MNGLRRAFSEYNDPKIFRSMKIGFAALAITGVLILIALSASPTLRHLVGIGHNHRVPTRHAKLHHPKHHRHHRVAIRRHRRRHQEPQETTEHHVASTPTNKPHKASHGVSTPQNPPHVHHPRHHHAHPAPPPPSSPSTPPQPAPTPGNSAGHGKSSNSNAAHVALEAGPAKVEAELTPTLPVEPVHAATHAAEVVPPQAELP